MSPRAVPPVPRVMLVDAGKTWRGAQRQLVLLAIGLRAHGLEPLVVAPPRSPLLHECKRAGVATAVRAMRGSLDIIAVRGLRRLITHWRPTIVHAHDPRAHALAMTALLGRTFAPPLVVTRRLASPPRGRIRHGARVARFIAITEAVRAALRAGGIADERITLVHPGVAAPTATAPRDWRTECDWPSERVVVGVVGPRATQAHRAELEQLIAATADSTQAMLALVLLGGAADGRTVVAGVPAYGAGFVHDVPAALAGLDLLLHPGGAEGLGTALVEGMALRVPAIAFAAGGVSEIIAPDRTGILVPADDGAAFATALDELVADPALRRRLGDSGPERAADFSVARMVDRTLEVYHAVSDGSTAVPVRG